VIVREKVQRFFENFNSFLSLQIGFSVITCNLETLHDVVGSRNSEQIVGLQPEVGHRAFGHGRRDSVFRHRRSAENGARGPDHPEGAP